LAKELSGAKDILNKTSTIENLLDELLILKDSSNKLDQARDLIDLIEKTKNIKEIDQFIEN
jgi:hypothetical protein